MLLALVAANDSVLSCDTNLLLDWKIKEIMLQPSH